jgi:hypothetical protein
MEAVRYSLFSLFFLSAKKVPLVIKKMDLFYKELDRNLTQYLQRTFHAGSPFFFTKTSNFQNTVVQTRLTEHAKDLIFFSKHDADADKKTQSY